MTIRTDPKRIDRLLSSGWIAEPVQLAGEKRWLAMPLEVQEKRRIAIVSSRLGRSPDLWPDWFRSLRWVVSRVGDDETIVTSRDSAAFPYVTRAAELFGKSTTTIELPARSETVEDWFERLEQVPAQKSPPRIYVSPPESPGKTPVADWALCASSTRITALYVRSRGNISALIESVLAELQAPVDLALAPKLLTPKLRDGLLDRGAVGIALFPRTAESLEHQESAPYVRHFQSCDFEEEFGGTGLYLTHCTRRRSGPWPDRTEREFLDDLILERGEAAHSPLDSLIHILQSDRLVASAESIRGSRGVVCFTSVPVYELSALRVFRPHRGRWDFEPYGMCIRKAFLQDRGAFAVQYDSDRAYERPAIHQPSKSTTKSGREIDWTLEQEWRIEGDLALDTIPSDQAFLFVPTEGEAQALRPHSRWPVVALTDFSNA